LKRALVTGGTGFVGANLVRRLLRDGHEVHLLLRAQSDMRRLKDVTADLRRHVAVLADAPSVARSVADARPDWIFHLAAYGAYSWQNDLAAMLQTNVVGSANVVQAGLQHGFEAFVAAGSSSEYGLKDHPPSETEWLEPNSDYGVTKAAATLFCRHTSLRCDVSLTTLRLYSVYGPYEDEGRLMPTLVRHALQGAWPPLVQPGTARDFVYVDDVVEAFLAAARPDVPRGAVYNVGSGRQTSLRDLVELARGMFGVTTEPPWGSLPPRRWDTTVWVADPAAIATDLGWRARTSLPEGLAALAAWCHGD
jgi:dolichol-phosphate mannosyltransferase